MRNLNQFITERLKIYSNANLKTLLTERLKINNNSKLSNVKLDRSFIDILDFIINDFEGYSFDSQWSLEFLYNIFCEAMPESAEVIHHAYNKNGKRIQSDMQMCTIKAGENLFHIKEDNNGQLEFDDNDKCLDIWGSGRESEVYFGICLIEDIFSKSTHFKIKEDQIDSSDIKNIFGIEDESKFKINISIYNVNGWKVYVGIICKKNATNLSNYIHTIVVLPNNNAYKNYYCCDGEGMTGSDDHYYGNDENDFKDGIKKLIENHLHL